MTSRIVYVKYYCITLLALFGNFKSVPQLSKDRVVECSCDASRRYAVSNNFCFPVKSENTIPCSYRTWSRHNVHLVRLAKTRDSNT